MDKRIHSKKSSNLTCRHYLFHFKWPLLGLIFLLTFLPFTQFNFTSILLSYLNIQDEQIKFYDTNVIYPIDILNKNQLNISIKYYFLKKDQLKIIDDVNAVAKKQKIVLPLIQDHIISDTYLIYEFTPVFGQPRFCSHTNEEIFGKICPYTNCKYTCDRIHKNDAQVLLMHKRDLDQKKLYRMKRNSEQIWLLWHDEPNENTPQINRLKFNWTITYRTSAEASIGAYGITIVKQKQWSIEEFNSWIDEQFINRYNQAVWFVSNCGPVKRLKKFHTLRQYYPIAAFGKCISPNESFSLNAQTQRKSTCNRQSSCEKTYLTKSKFYLAFESQSCTDYITEKFWRTLALGAIPVVSGPERENFIRIAPPNSFIHVDDYASDNELAQALNSIGRNKNLYKKYHKWRRYYDVYHEGKDLDPYRFCELCYRLNTNKQRIWYEKINDWFLDKC